VIITAPSDAQLADFVDLADPAARRRRERHELFIAEGLVAVQRLLESPHQIRSILVTPKRRHRVEALPGATDAVILVADSEVVARTVGFNFHRGVIASAERRPLPHVTDVVASSHRVVVLVGLNDPENLGLIARAARAFGVDALVLDPTCIDPYYRRTVRVSMGEVLLLDVARCDDWPAGIDVLHDAGLATWAMTPAEDATSIWDTDVPERLALVLGAEGPGLDPATLQRASQRVRIPIRSSVDSLNVGHAAAVALAITDQARRTTHRVETMGLEPTTPTLQR
jgi:tRNA G18 (ribose-2'-O)-methylase SpoU